MSVALNPKLLENKSKKEAEAIAKEFLEPFQKIAESRNKLVESEEELRGLISNVMAKLDSLGELKKANMELEREVLQKIKAQL